VAISDEAGRRVLFETGAVTVPAAGLALRQNYPNPFNPSTSIPYSIPAKSAVSLEIFDVSGRFVARLMGGEQAQGSYVATWEGKDELGRTVASGIYLYRLKVGDGALTRKMILLR
jgi:flagellar hook assembly protein FlgD